jgi:DNA mismatch endonuclease (patch repair protein)
LAAPSRSETDLPAGWRHTRRPAPEKHPALDWSTPLEYERIVESKLKKTLPDGKFLNVPKLHSERMAKVRSRGNRSTEIPLRLALRLGLRGWELHPRDIFGCPDFYFRRPRVAVFIDGCFWHNCPRCGHIPSKRTAYWVMKFRRNRLRSKLVRRHLASQGITVVRVWEHEIRRGLHEVTAKLTRTLRERK